MFYLCHMIVLLILNQPAYANIDVGIGSMLVQGLVAALMLVPFYFRKIISFFKKKKTENSND
ncbi:MAG: hypothetical protein IKZ02_00695 [Alphaproteobacteria bacterium]|nr:hypothetical protein [Alphaproteobacteria bacterium]